MEAVLIVIEYIWGFLRVRLLEMTFFCWVLQEEVIEGSLSQPPYFKI